MTGRILFAVAAVGAGALGLFSGAVGAATATLYVSPAGVDAGACTTPAAPCATLAYAVAQAAQGATIDAATGTYAGVALGVGKVVTLSGGWDAAFASRPGGSTIDGQGLGRGVTVSGPAELTISRFTIEGGVAAQGGGLYASPSSTVRIVESTLEGNTATSGGGAVAVDGATVAAVNTTIATNHSDGDGGGVEVTGSGATLRLSNVTIASNSAAGDGGGIFDAGVADEAVTLHDTAIGGNTAGDLGDDCSTGTRVLESRGYNAVGTTSGCTIQTALGDQVDTSLYLVPLAANGGPGRTEALQPRSPLIDAGDPAGCTDDTGAALATDERGRPRPATPADACDIGAYEVQPPANDDFAQRQFLAGDTVHVGGGNNEASTEPGEPEHAGDEGGASVWYDWMPSTSGTFVVDTSGSSFDTLLAVYIGSTLADLAPVSAHIASNDDAAADDQTSVACFPATAGAHYEIAVDGYAGDAGAVALNIAPKPDTAPCPTRPPLVTPTAPRVGDTVHASGGVWANADDAHATHQWYRCQAEACRPIDGETGMDHVVTARDVGTTLRIDEIEGGLLSTSDPTAAVGTTASAASGNGRIYWANNLGGPFAIWSMLPDGSSRRQLTSGGDPAPSPDGSRIAFDSGATIAIMNPDGSGVVGTGLSGFSPSWSPDGSRLVYTHYDTTYHRVDGIDVADADGSHDVALLRGGLDPATSPFLDPVWSPDGARIAFTFLDEATGHYDIGLVAADGRGGILDLTNTAAEDEHSPAWSPDGTELVFVRGPLSGGLDRGDLYRIGADGSGETGLVTGTTSADMVSSGVWSPDGRTILISRYGAGGTDDLYTISAVDGGGQTPVLSMTSRDESQAWAVPVSYALSVSDAGAGSGTVTSSPGGITCGGACSAAFADGATVTLTAAPASGSAFAGWSGACSGTGSCSVSMLGARSVTATFDQAPPPPPASGGGGGGDGGSSGIPPDIHVEVTASAGAPPAVGAELLWFVTVGSRNVGGSSDVRLDLTLPAGWTYDHSYADRGPGCVGTPPHLTCDVGFINQTSSTHVTLWGTVAQAGDLTLTATAASQLEPEFDPKDNTVTLTLAQPAPAAPPPAPAPRPAPPAVTGAATVGATLRTAPRTGARFQWQLCTATGCTAIRGATRPTLKLLRTYAGKSVRVAVTRNGTTTLSRKVRVRARAAAR